MLVFKFLLVVLLVAGSQGDCSEGSCREDSPDHAEFMQRQALATIVPKGTLIQRGLSPKAIDDMLSEMRTMATKYRTKGKLPPTEQGHVETIKQLVKQSLIPVLVATRNDAEQELWTLIGAISKCNSNSTMNQANMEMTTAASVNTSRAEHANCRAAEDILSGIKKEKCDDLAVFLEGIHEPATLPTATAGMTPDSEAMGSYLKAMEDYFCGKHVVFETKNSACVNATYSLDSKTQSCDVSQVAFEGGFCFWRQALTDLCEASTACYDAAVAAYTTRERAIAPLVAQWKAEFTGLKKIECYVEIWLSDGNVTTVEKPKVGYCDQLKVDDSPMNITFPEVPAFVGCDKSPVSKYPGSGMFHEEYAQVSHTKNTTACPVPFEGAPSPSPMPPEMPPSDDPWAGPPSGPPSDDPWAGPSDDPWAGPPSDDATPGGPGGPPSPPPSDPWAAPDPKSL